jgi:uncharacterized protein (DUF433 family)
MVPDGGMSAGCEPRTAHPEATGTNSRTIRYNVDNLFQELEVLRVFDRITFERNTMGGRACIRGMRIPVSVIVGQFAHGASEEEILTDYPELETEDIRQALEYASWLAQEEVRVGQS